MLQYGGVASEVRVLIITKESVDYCREGEDKI